MLMMMLMLMTMMYTSQRFFRKYKSMFGNKLEKIQAMSTSFSGFAVYDLFIPSFKAAWAFAIGIAPDLTKNAGLIDKELGKKLRNYLDLQKADPKLRRYLELNLEYLERGAKPKVAGSQISAIDDAVAIEITNTRRFGRCEHRG